MDDENPYSVGYRKPPKASRFKEGKSGNPSGRPKSNPSIGEVFRKVSSRKVRTNGPNGPGSMTKLEASITQLVNKSAAGDLKAMKLIMLMAIKFPELITGPPTFPCIEVRFVSPDRDENNFVPPKPLLLDK